MPDIDATTHEEGAARQGEIPTATDVTRRWFQEGSVAG